MQQRAVGSEAQGGQKALGEVRGRKVKVRGLEEKEGSARGGDRAAGETPGAGEQDSALLESHFLQVKQATENHRILDKIVTGRSQS